MLTSCRIDMHGQGNYAAAVEKYGQEFADAVVAQELQLYADNLDCFDEYGELEGSLKLKKPTIKRCRSGSKNRVVLAHTQNLCRN